MFKIGDRVKYTGTIYGVNNEIGTVVGYDGELNVVHYPNVKNAFLHNCGVFNEYEYLYISNCNLELVNNNKGVIDMIKAGDKVRVLNAEDGIIWEVIKVVKDVAQVINDDIAQIEIFALENLKKVVEENDEKMAVLPKELFQIGDRVVANCTSDKGKYRLGDAGTVVKFRDDKDGADVGVKFDHKKDTIITWIYPDNIVHEDCTLDFSYFEEDVAPAPVEYGMIKIFNLTSLRKNGWEFDHQGNLNLSGTEKSISGLMLNIIDGEFMAYEDDCEDNIYIVGEDGVEYVIDKALKGKLFKKI